GGIEREPIAQPAYLGSLATDLPEQPRLAEGVIAPKEVIVQGADPLGDGPIEATNLFHQCHIHSGPPPRSRESGRINHRSDSLTIVREYDSWQGLVCLVEENCHAKSAASICEALKMPVARGGLRWARRTAAQASVVGWSRAGNLLRAFD